MKTMGVKAPWIDAFGFCPPRKSGIHFDSTINVTWDQVGNKPTEFPPEDHNHEIADVNGLQTALDNLSADGHTHEIDDVNGLQDALDGKASIIQIVGGTY